MFIPVTPLAKPRMTASDKWKKRPVVLKYREYKDALRPHNIPDINECNIVFVIPMPASWSEKKRKQMLLKPHVGKPDIDNLLKGLMDAIYKEDAHVWSVWPQKIWGNNGGIGIRKINEVIIDK